MRQQLHQVFMIVALPTILSLGLLTFLLRDSLHDWAIERWSSDQYAYVESLAHDIEADITQAAELLRIAAATDAFEALTELKHIDLSINGIPEHLDSGKRRIMEHLRTNGGFSVVFVLTPEGDHYISHPFSVQRSLKKYNLSDRPYFQQATTTRQISISDSFSGADGVPAVAIDLPIVDAQGEIAMHLGGVLHLKHLSDFLAAYKINPFDFAVLRDRNNQRIAESDASRLAEPVAEPLLSYTRSTNDIVKTTAPELSIYNTHTARFSDGSGKRWFAYDATLSSGWHLMLFRSEAALNSVIAPQVRELTLFAAAIVLLPGLIGLGVANRFRRRWLEARNKLVESHQMLEQRVVKRTKELQRSEAQHRTLFETSTEGILILDGDRFTDCNPAAIKLFGAASRDDLLDHHPWELSPPSQPELGDSKDAAQITIKKALDDGFNELEWRHRRLDNQNDFDARVLLSRMEIDDRVLIQVSIRDITERKQALELLKISEAIHRNILETALDGFWRLDAQGRLLDVNPAYSKQSGYSREELLKMHITDLEAEEDIHETERHIQHVIATGNDRFETRHRRKDGSLWDVEISATFSRIDGEHFVVFLRDITERERAKHELIKANEVLSRESEFLFRTNEIARVGGWEFDLVTNKLYWTPETYRIHEVDPSIEPEIDKALSYYPPEAQPKILAAVEDCMADGATYDLEVPVITATGRHIWVRTQGFAHVENDKVIKLRGSIQDITEHKKAEQLLQISEQRFRDIILASADWVWEVDVNARYTYASDNVFTLLGFRSEEIIGQTPFDLMPPDEAERVGGIFTDIAARKETFHDLENINCHRDGSLRTVSTNGVPILGENGELCGYRGMDRDITAQKRIDSLLNFIAQRSWSKDGQAFLPALAQALGAMLQVDYVFINRLSDEPAEAETVGLYARGAVAPNRSYCLAGTPCEHVIGKEACVYPRGIQQLFPEDHLLVDMEAESYLGIPLWDSAGQAIGLIALVDSKPLDDRDKQLGLLNLISAAASAELERLRDERALREERDRAQGYLDTVEAMIVALDPNGQIVRINRKACQLLGWQEAELVGENWFEKCLPQTQTTEVYSAFSKLIAGDRGNQEYFENQLVTRSGDRLDVAWHNAILRQDDGKIVGTLSAGEDITARKQTELALRRAQKMEAVGQLTGGIAHDFNNILGIIIGNLDLLNYVITDDTALNHVESAKKSALRAADLTKQLLGFSRQQSAQLVHSDIRRVIREMESLITRSLTPEIVVEQQFAEDLWQTDIDPGDFQDALLNLAINARDAMPDGGQLTLEARNCSLDADYCEQNPGATPGEYVQLAVSDNGMGIAPENSERIFEPFFTTKPQGKGTGLGLAMVYGFTKRSKGYIQLYSEQGIGTTIRLYLPRAKGEEQSMESSAKPVDHLPRGHETILVVDDEEALLTLAQQSLQALGYRVLTASSGRQAMERLAEESGIELLLSDVVMPGGMSGYELAEQATNAHPQLKVLLTSGYTGRAALHNGQARFAANLLSKPYSQAELAQGVRTLLGESDMSEPECRELEQAAVQPSVVSIEWTDALSIGVDAIDADHKTLLALLNRCQQAIELKESEHQMQSILDELSDYVRSHFQREEAVMAAVDYPGFESHRQVHQLLLKQVEKNRGLLKRGELTIGDLVALLHSWLIDHIDNMDGAIKPYCEGKKNLIEQALEQAGIARKKEDQS